MPEYWKGAPSVLPKGRTRREGGQKRGAYIIEAAPLLSVFFTVTQGKETGRLWRSNTYCCSSREGKHPQGRGIRRGMRPREHYINKARKDRMKKGGGALWKKLFSSQKERSRIKRRKTLTCFGSLLREESDNRWLLRPQRGSLQLPP